MSEQNNINGNNDRPDWLSRRNFLRAGLAGAAGVLLGGKLAWAGGDALSRPATSMASASRPAAKGKAKSVIQLWAWGGPTHIDTFDPKPAAGSDYTGPLDKPIATNVDGIIISELLPLMAKQADKYAIIRSMTHGYDGHETAAYIAQTGRAPGGRLVYPCTGAVVSLLRGYDAGYKDLIPPYIVITEPQGRFSESGFLGIRYMPFATGGDPNRDPFAVEGVVASGITAQRQTDRRQLLDHINTLSQAEKHSSAMTQASNAQEQAYGLILGNAGKVFDLSQESPATRDRYGRNRFGQSCLAARRLVEHGVPYVTINDTGWDMHTQIVPALRRKLPELDQGFSALLEDLSSHGLLDSTIVWWGGEFGRTPRFQQESPWNGGRNHYGKVYSCVLAGGGFKGGCVVGASDAKGAEVETRPVYPCDLIGSIYEQLGIDPDALMPNPLGLQVRITPDASEGVKSAGRLKEIM